MLFILKLGLLNVYNQTLQMYGTTVLSSDTSPQVRFQQRFFLTTLVVTLDFKSHTFGLHVRLPALPPITGRAGVSPVSFAFDFSAHGTAVAQWKQFLLVRLQDKANKYLRLYTVDVVSSCLADAFGSSRPTYLPSFWV